MADQTTYALSLPSTVIDGKPEPLTNPETNAGRLQLSAWAKPTLGASNMTTKPQTVTKKTDAFFTLDLNSLCIIERGEPGYSDRPDPSQECSTTHGS
jgi:hypothetical protein